MSTIVAPLLLMAVQVVTMLRRLLPPTRVEMVGEAARRDHELVPRGSGGIGAHGGAMLRRVTPRRGWPILVPQSTLTHTARTLSRVAVALVMVSSMSAWSAMWSIRGPPAGDGQDQLVSDTGPVAIEAGSCHREARGSTSHRCPIGISSVGREDPPVGHKVLLDREVRAAGLTT